MDDKVNMADLDEELRLQEAAMLKDVSFLLESFGRERGNLIPILQMVQKRHSCLAPEALRLVASHLGIGVCQVYGMATFYNQFRFNPPGKHQIEGAILYLRISSASFRSTRGRQPLTGSSALKGWPAWGAAPLPRWRWLTKMSMDTLPPEKCPLPALPRLLRGPTGLTPCNSTQIRD